MSKKGKPNGKKRPKPATNMPEEALRPRKLAKAAKPPKYNHLHYWLSEAATMQ